MTNAPHNGEAIRMFSQSLFPLNAWTPDKRLSRLLLPHFERISRFGESFFDPGTPIPPAELGEELDAIEAQQQTLESDKERVTRILKQDNIPEDLLYDSHNLRNDDLKKDKDLVWIWTLYAMAISATSPLTLTLKERYARPRPYHLRPNSIKCVVPVEPGHPAYPSSHACQTHLASLALVHVIDPLGSDPGAQAKIFAAAADVAVNREFAGVHYRSDSDAGRRLATALFPICRANFAEIFFLADRGWRAWQCRKSAANGRPNLIANE